MRNPLRDLVVVRGAGAPAVLDRATQPPPDDAPADGLSDGADPVPTMRVQFSVFNAWYEVNSYFEGRFLERVGRGSFAKTIAERGSQLKVLFNHGHDFQIGDKILGRASLLEERAEGPYMEVPLLDTSYNRDLIPGLEAGGYGSSFMFNVIRDEWNEEPGRSDSNPDGIPERTILEVRLLEAGPVTWPANPAATAGMRSLTDWYAERLRTRSPERLRSLEEHYTDFRAQHGLHTSIDDAAPQGTSPLDAVTMPTEAPDTPEVVHPRGLSPNARARELAFPFLFGSRSHEHYSRAAVGD